MFLAGGICFSDGECAAARQYMGLEYGREYGTSVDPMAALAIKIEETMKRFGQDARSRLWLSLIRSASSCRPFAAGRAFLSELGKDAPEGAVVCV